MRPKQYQLKLPLEVREGKYHSEIKSLVLPSRVYSLIARLNFLTHLMTER